LNSFSVIFVAKTFMITDKRAMTTEKAIAILKKQNQEITVEEISVVMDFLYLLAEIYLSEGPEI
jgi:hypothetical protein